MAELKEPRRAANRPGTTRGGSAVCRMARKRQGGRGERHARHACMGRKRHGNARGRWDGFLVNYTN